MTGLLPAGFMPALIGFRMTMINRLLHWKYRLESSVLGQSAGRSKILSTIFSMKTGHAVGPRNLEMSLAPSVFWNRKWRFNHDLGNGYSWEIIPGVELADWEYFYLCRLSHIMSIRAA